MKFLVLVSLQLLFGSILAFGEINFEGYQLDRTTMQMIPVFYPEFQGRILCGKQTAVDAKIELIQLQEDVTFKFPNFSKVLKIASDDHGNFKTSVSRGDWKLIVRATCEKRTRITERMIRIESRPFIAPVEDRELIVDVNQEKFEIKREIRCCIY